MPIEKLPIREMHGPEGMWTLRGGRVLCPANRIDALRNVRVVGGKITAIEPPNCMPPDAGDVDVSGSIVVPGLIDLHVHTAQAMSSYGACADRNGIASGVCHVNDMAGTGWLSANVLRAYSKLCTTSLSGTMYVAGAGNPENWVLGCPEICDASTSEELLLGALQANRDLFTSIKVHVDLGFMALYGADPLRGFWVARRVSKKLGIPLYLHLGLLGPHDGHLESQFGSLLAEVIAALVPGDIIGHVLSPWPGTPLDTNEAVWSELLSRHDLYWEVGHGFNLCFDRARRWLDSGRPLLISSDAHLRYGHLGKLHEGKLRHQTGPLNAYTLVGAMSKLRALGFSLSDVVRGASCTPARALGLQDRMGELTVGRSANITVLEDRAGDFTYCDSVGKALQTDRILMPQMTALDGRLWQLFPDQLEEFSMELDAHDDRDAPGPLGLQGGQGVLGPQPPTPPKSRKSQHDWH